MKIDFIRLRIYPGIDRQRSVEMDVRKDFADLIYQKGKGVAAHALALKIYNSAGGEEYGEEEVLQIRNYAESFVTPMFIDAVNEAVEQCKG